MRGLALFSPIPFTIDKYSLELVNISVPLCVTYTWCNASDVAVATWAVDFKAINLSLSSVAIVLMPVFSSNLDSTNCVLSLLSSWSGAKNLYVPIPADVVPNPTILDLTLIGLDLVLVTLNDKILLPIPESDGLNDA